MEAVGRRCRERGRIAGLIACAILLAVPAAANAEQPGTSGKIAVIPSVGSSPAFNNVDVFDPYASNPTAPQVVAHTNAPPPSPTVPYIGSIGAPSWSADGTRIAYTRYAPDPGDGGYHTAIFSVGWDGSNDTQLTTPPAYVPSNCGNNCDNSRGYYDTSPSFSPDGKSLAFIRLDGYAQDVGTPSDENIWIAGPGGTNKLTKTTTDQGVFQSAVWSPDGTHLLAYFIDKHSGPELDVVDASSGVATRIFQAPAISDYDWAPDGQSLVVATINTGSGGAYLVQQLDLSGNPLYSFTASSLPIRFSSDGNGILHNGCIQVTGGSGSFYRCGLLERRVPDSGGDVHANDPPDRLIADFGTYASQIPPAQAQSGGRMAFDVQAQQLPIVFVPGFLGSEIYGCSNSRLWPPPGANLSAMALGSDGSSNAGCYDAAPDGQLVRTVATEDIYGNVSDWLTSIAPNGQVVLMGWDWRRSTQDNLTALDNQINNALQYGPAQKAGATRVVLFGHSYGGLLIRHYIQSSQAHLKRVARVLTLGSPYWGSPKAIFPLAFGVETPLLSGMDVLLHDRPGMKILAQNLTSLYQFYPSSNYGNWLSVCQATCSLVGEDGVANEVNYLGGNTTLLSQAQTNHSNIYDGFYDAYGSLDVRAVVGTGEPTINLVNLTHLGNGQASVDVSFTTGDGTVPGRSAAQGQVSSSAAPLTAPGNYYPMHVQYVCNVGHVDLPAAPSIENAYKDFLLRGRNPRQLPAPCQDHGSAIVIHGPYDIGVPSHAAARSGAAPVRAASTPTASPESLPDAAVGGLIDVIQTDPADIVVTSDALPQPLTFQANGTTFTIARIDGDTTGSALAYGPLTGTVVVTPGQPGTPPSVTLNGQPIEGTPVGGGPAVGGGGSDTGVGGGSETGVGSASASTSPVVSAPAITGLTISPSAFRAVLAGRSRKRQRGGATITYRDSETATATVTVQQSVPAGKRSACGGQRKRQRHARGRCQRTISLGSFTHSDSPGVNRLSFSGVLNGRRLRRGNYMLVVTARNAAGASRPATAAFRISG